MYVLPNVSIFSETAARKRMEKSGDGSKRTSDVKESMNDRQTHVMVCLFFHISAAKYPFVPIFTLTPGVLGILNSEMVVSV